MKDNFNGRIVVGLIEKISIVGEEHNINVLARIDTGAERSSIDEDIVSQLNLEINHGTVKIRNANGSSLREITKVKVLIEDKIFESKFSIRDRSKLKYPVLIGQDILRKGFLIDPNKKLSKK